MSLPDYTKEGIDAYVEDGVPPGEFLRAVLANDLMEAFGQADTNNRAAMFYICMYIYNQIPREAWGSYEKVKAWIKVKNHDRNNTG